MVVCEKKTDVGQIQIGDQVPNQTTHKKKKNRPSRVPSAPDDPGLAEFLKSEEFIGFLLQVKNEPHMYKHIRDVLEKIYPDVEKILSKYRPQDPLLEVIIESEYVVLHPLGNAFYKFIRSEEFQNFRSAVLAEPHKYKKLRKEFNEKLYYGEELQSLHPFSDPLLLEIVESLIDDGAHSFPDRLRILDNSAELQSFIKKMESHPEHYKDRINILLQKDPFVAVLLGSAFDFDHVEKYKKLSFREKLVLTLRSRKSRTR